MRTCLITLVFRQVGLATSLLLLSCHLVLPYTPGQEPATDAAGRDLVTDVRLQDGFRFDGTKPNKDLAGEAVVLDGSPMDAAPPPCFGQNPLCKPPASPNLDIDCDGLPYLGAVVQDPWSKSCNKLLFSDEFKTHPASRWDGTAYQWSFGKLTVKPGSTLSLKTSQTASFTTSGHLAELRFKAKGTFGYGNKVGIEASAPAEKLSCTAWAKYKSGEVYLFMSVKSLAGALGYITAQPAPLVPGTYILQSWSVNKTHTCRLLSAAGEKILAKVYGTPIGRTKAPTSIKVSTVGISAEVSHVRIYREP